MKFRIPSLSFVPYYLLIIISLFIYILFTCFFFPSEWSTTYLDCSFVRKFISKVFYQTSYPQIASSQADGIRTNSQPYMGLSNIQTNKFVYFVPSYIRRYEGTNEYERTKVRTYRHSFVRSCYSAQPNLHDSNFQNVTITWYRLSKLMVYPSHTLQTFLTSLNQ